MSDLTPAAALHGEGRQALTTPDLDQRFNLKLRTMQSACLTLMYADFARWFDVAAMRKRGLASVLSFVDFACEPVPLAIGQDLQLAHQLRLREGAMKGASGQGRRLLLDTELSLASREGTGDIKRYRDIVDRPEPVPVGRARAVLTLIRPFAPAEERLVTEPPEEMRRLSVTPMEEPSPTVERLKELGHGFRPLSALEVESRTSVWGLHHTDINQAVFTGEYISAMEEHFSRLVHAAGLPVAKHQVTRAALVLNRPFSAGNVYQVQGKLFTDGERTALLGGFYPVLSQGEVAPRPSVFARLEGSCR